MKRLLVKPYMLPVILIVLYLACLLLGAYVISAYPIYRQEEVFGEQARIVAQEYPEGVEDALDALTGANMRILIYDGQGTCRRYVAPGDPSSAYSMGILLQKDIPSALNGREIFRVALARETQRMFPDIMVVVGAPIREQDSVVGAVFLVKNLLDLPTAVLAYAVYFTIFYWLSAFFIVSNIRKNRKLDKLRQTYIANVTHALKTPVASIKALAETLCDGVEPDPDQQRVYYGMILREANRQHHMIQDILELSKLQSDGMDFTKTNVYAAAALGPVLDKYAALCDCMGISLHISEEISQLPPLYTNAACLKQLLEILLDNALKFVYEGGDIWVDAACGRNKATICVRDNGIGIAEDALPHVFERFFKCSHDFNASGSGLGLAIAQEIISGLREKIWVESKLGKGTSFFFTVHLIK